MNTTQRTSKIIDLSHRLNPATPVYPGDAAVEIEIVDVAREPTATSPRGLNNSRIAMGLHNGTHLDAPFHFFSERQTIDQIPLRQCCGPAVCLDLSQTARPGQIDAADLAPHAELAAARKIVLLYTGWCRCWNAPEYFESHPVLTRAAAETLVQWEIGLVGVDFPSVDQPPFEAHVVLLGNDVLIVENLRDLSRLCQVSFDFFAIPLRIEGRDASPVRAFAMLHEPH